MSIYPTIDMERCVSEMESTLNYTFKDKKLLEDALTHPSYPKSTSYQRLEFLGDAVLKLAFARYAHFAYPTVDEGILHILTKFNTMNENLARVAVHHGFYRCVRCSDLGVEAQVREFTVKVEAEDNTVVYGGKGNTPNVLADIVESISAAVYLDCDSNLKIFWEVIKGLLEPFILTLETLPLQLEKMLNELCQGKPIDTKHLKKHDKNSSHIYVDSDQKHTAELSAELKAANDAWDGRRKSVNKMDVDYEVTDKGEIKIPKSKLQELCDKKKWPNPIYSWDEQETKLGDKKFKCSVKIQIEDVELIESGDAKSKVKEAKGSAASVMFLSLVKSGFVRGA